MFSSAIKKVSSSLFPVFYQVIQDDVIHVGVRGTGFFIDNNGFFLTANHVFDVPNTVGLFYAGNVPYHMTRQFVPIEIIYQEPKNDLLLGRVTSDFFPGVEFASCNPKIGASVCLSGYPLSKIDRDDNGHLDLKGVRKYWQPTCVVDYYNIIYQNLSYNSFISQHTSLSGMSGGPVFDVNGTICGIDVATWTRAIQDTDETTKVTNGIIVHVEAIKEFLNRSGYLQDIS